MTRIQGFTVGAVVKEPESVVQDGGGKQFLSFAIRLDDRDSNGKVYKGQRVTVKAFGTFLDGVIRSLKMNDRVIVSGDIQARGYENQGKNYAEIIIVAQTVEMA